MKLNLYSIRDVKAAVFLAPFPSRSDVDATRQISSSMSSPQMQETPIVQNPDDFALYSVAVFDDETGVIEPFAPRQIATISSLIPRAQLPS